MNKPSPTGPAGEHVRSVREQRAEQPLYINRIKVYPRKVEGFYRRIKWTALALCLAVYYIVPWLRWDRGPSAPSQAVLLDLPGRRGYFFWIEIWPQEVYFLTGLLILGAVGLFLVTSYVGRVWCGYACPQTVWTDLFMLVERWIEGDRNARIKLDKAAWGLDKAWRKVAKHLAWLAIGAATGGAWVFYFVDAPTTFVEIFTGRASFTVYMFIALFTVSTYTLAGWAREQVCTYMCPWPRFQAAMFDEHTLTVTYRAWRGEPRGKHKAGTSWEGRGDCIDCGSCVAVCPTGIDIRDGQQLECIGCGLCIDACDAVMTKVERPTKLIAFDTLTHVQGGAARAPVRFSWFRPRPMVYAGILVIVAVVMVAALALRHDTELHVLRDRAPLYVTLSDGSIRNGYTIKILNKARESRSYTLAVGGLPGARLAVAGEEAPVLAEKVTIVARADTVGTHRVHVTAAAAARETIALDFQLLIAGRGSPLVQRSAFVSPKH
ncbi:MAG: cytochrome c oxidase accessory protein CcoG [Alphaproteobacteria bacterium]|nr:cytochrome c oxidase accessory protein CcoG [Alphaproteobacteria bacterium]